MVNVLIVYAHPEPTSFSGALKDCAVQTFADLGHHVTVSDLYAENFNPVAGRHDFTTVAEPNRFHYQNEQLHASMYDGFAEDLKREQKRMLDADLLIFVFPLWWGGIPAILKGWFDRVLAYGVAYADGERFTSGRFLGRKGIMCLTTGGTKKRFSDSDVYGDMKKVLYPIHHCMLEYMGLDVEDPFVAYAAPRVDNETRVEYLNSWEKKLREMAENREWQERLKKMPNTRKAIKPVDERGWELDR
ncbi:NAD(P)H-dependent oxidoreductase [Neobacillus niacini]|uniref:NAD(P)H-dependent oxidoreductase n=1 Tax=Neobacillus niacini TaxID=86668 RepID=UPI0021CAEC12|nr:NAD(P)H-dependent oxidoreductase [Neobacillus niacini]MCM3766305.1 NAD(P)H-dependent oxidoreductase [Neobacillus niacini]